MVVDIGFSALLLASVCALCRFVAHSIFIIWWLFTFGAINEFGSGTISEFYHCTVYFTWTFVSVDPSDQPCFILVCRLELMAIISLDGMVEFWVARTYSS